MFIVKKNQIKGKETKKKRSILLISLKNLLLPDILFYFCHNLPTLTSVTSQLKFLEISLDFNLIFLIFLRRPFYVFFRLIKSIYKTSVRTN